MGAGSFYKLVDHDSCDSSEDFELTTFGELPPHVSCKLKWHPSRSTLPAQTSNLPAQTSSADVPSRSTLPAQTSNLPAQTSSADVPNALVDVIAPVE
jgi:hypothetical protein